MNCPKAIAWLLAVFFGLISPPANTQINLKTGYHFSMLASDGINRVVGLFDDTRYTSSFPELHWLHGFEAGLRWKHRAHGLELSYLGVYQQLRATGITTSDNSSFSDKIRFSVQSACIGYQLSGEYFGVGGEIQYQWYRTHANFEQPPRDFKHIQPMLGYSVYLLFTLPGRGSIDMALKPYYTFPAESYDHHPLQSFNGAEILIPEEKWKRFGISLLFYNGDQ